MTNEERVNNYIEKLCVNCKNRKNCAKNTIEVTEDTTKCSYYIKDKQLKGYKEPFIFNIFAKKSNYKRK